MAQQTAAQSPVNDQLSSAATGQLSGVRTWLCRRVPALDSLRTYSWRSFGCDLTAGVTVATVAVPQAMAYGILAGLPPQYGLYTAIVMTAVGAVLDSSRQLINGPTNAISIAMLSALATVPEAERVSAAILLALLVGTAQLGIAFLRLGDLTRYISHSVMVGFTVGAGTLLVLDQLKNLFGLHARGLPTDSFLKRFWLTITTNGGIHWPTFLIGAATIALVLAVRHYNRVRREHGARFPFPQHLVAIAVMTSIVWIFGLDEGYGVTIVGMIPASLPQFQLPDWNGDLVRMLAGNAFAIGMLGLLEALAMAKAISIRTGQKLDIDQQCLSEGVANFAGSFFQCMPGSGSLTRSTVNQQAGAVTQWSGVFSAAAVAGTVVAFAPLARYIPQASLAGLLMLAAFRMVDWSELMFHLRATRFDAGVVIVTALAAVLISIEFCIFIGVFLSFVLYVPRAAQVQIVEYLATPENDIRVRLPAQPPCNRLLIIGLEGELFFGSQLDVQRHLDTVRQTMNADTRAVVLVVQRARNPDAVFLSLLREFNRTLWQRKVALFLCEVEPELDKALAATGLAAEIGHNRIFRVQASPNAAATDAVRTAYELIGHERCETCPRQSVGRAETPLAATEAPASARID